MKHHRFHSSAAAFAAILFTSMPPASAATDYSVTVLECPIVFMYCENPSYLASNGLVAGLDFGASNPNFWGFGGQRLYSDPQPFTYGLTTSINKHGVALISANENGDGHFFWNNGVYSQVPANINHPNFPGKINDVGQIAVGLTNGHQALWDNGVLTDLGTISGGRFSVARRIGDNAEIVGYVNTEDGLKQAVLWANGAATALGVLPGDTTSEAWAINATGDVFGFSYGIDTARPFRWSNGVMTELAPAGLFNPPQSFGVKGAYAIDMNSRGQIIAVDSTTSDYRAFLWDDGVVTELNSKLGYVSGNKDLDGMGGCRVQAINDAGQIAGKCVGVNPVVLTPAAPGTNLALNMSAAPNPIVQGNVLTYTIGVTNAGSLVATGVGLVDALPGNVSLVSFSASQGSCSQTSAVVCSLGDLAGGASASVQIVVVANAAGTISNTASVTSTEVDINPDNNSATSSVTVDAPVVTADLGVTMSASASTVKRLSNLTYTVNLRNSGPASASGVILTDTLPSSMKFVSASTSQGSCSGTTTVTCSLGSMANGASAVVKIVAQARSVGTFTNTAKVSSSVTDNNAVNNSASVTTKVR